ncbi:MAG: hypothetical protein ABI181_08215 [Mycobacteriaceae bacterium]
MAWGDITAQLDDIQTCAAALSNAAPGAGAAADDLTGISLGADAAGTTATSAALVSAATQAAAHWADELEKGATLLRGLGAAVDADAVKLRNTDHGLGTSIAGGQS